MNTAITSEEEYLKAADYIDDSMIKMNDVMKLINDKNLN